MQNLSDHLKRKKVKHQSTNKDNLWDVLNQSWNNIKPEVLIKLHFITNRVNAVLKAKEVIQNIRMLFYSHEFM